MAGKGKKNNNARGEKRKKARADKIYEEGKESFNTEQAETRSDKNEITDIPKSNLFANRRQNEQAVVVNYGSSWMVTFTDLVALMLTFFVLLYSMSVMEEKQWRNLVDSLASNLKIEGVIAEPKPAKSLTMEPVDFIPGEDLDYLQALLSEKFKSDSDLSQAVLTRLDDRVVVSVPGDLLFSTGAIEPMEEAQPVLRRLGRIFQNISNKIEIAGHADPAVPSGEQKYQTNWPLSVARANYVAGLLEKSGYRGTILSRGYGDSRYDEITDRLSEDQREKLARRVDIIVHSYAGENG
ncbi:flagellar motor protein MotB [uncultured Kiloniella sp.]|uniref:OmpA/MotB family protein n=1 Tax=uncultured Kiloniella sp. TaxID=1133091 RepID=UPI002605F401|nr:flagellar motor protein MotB [uncultured Kiloniella sp.]